jgi:quercetin dioxygenase-like cupin family protein
MFKPSTAVAVTLMAGLAARVAIAGQCSADKMVADATKPDSSPAKGVTDNVLAAIDLAQEPAKINNRVLRMRKLTIAPGGVVPWHSHADPAIYIINGEITRIRE